MRASLALFALAGCAPIDDDVAYIVVYEQVEAVLGNQIPTRSWDVHVETNANAMRDGPTWTTVGVEAMVTVDNDQEWNDLWVDASLSAADEAVEESAVSLQFLAPAQASFDLQERYQADCVVGDVCVWSYPLVISRRDGQHGIVAVQFEARALVTLGPESEAPEGAALSIEVRETTDL